MRMDRRGFLKSMAVAVVAPTVLKGAVFPAPLKAPGVTLEQCIELGRMTLKDMPRIPWVNYYASYDYDMTELDRGKLRAKIGKEVGKIKGCAVEDNGIDRGTQVSCDYISLGEQRLSDARRQESFLEDCYPDGPVVY